MSGIESERESFTMAKKTTTPSTTASSPAVPRARRPVAKKPAAAPVDVATVAGTEPLESAPDRATSSVTGDNGAAPSADEIAQAAYQRYLSRGGQHGADFDDWIEAERELRQKRTR